MTTMSESTTIQHTEILAHPSQTLTVEWDRDARWDEHWLIVFTTYSGVRQVLRRKASYTEARADVRDLADRVNATLKAFKKR
jgi:hypothetical protein